MRIVVTGASGTLGRVVLPQFLAAGHDVRGLSRLPRTQPRQVTWVLGDLSTGEGLAQAVCEADTVIHLASAPYRRGYTRQVDVEGTHRLVKAASAAGVQHLLYVSIVGVDQIPWGYFRTKVEAERIVRSGGLGWTILRAAQFFDFIDTALRAAGRLPVIPYDPGIRAQPVHPADVARRMLQLVESGPTESTHEFGGPEVLTMRDAVREWLDVTGKNRALVPVRIPGRLGRAFRAGHLTTTTPGGTITWRDYLIARTSTARALGE